MIIITDKSHNDHPFWLYSLVYPYILSSYLLVVLHGHFLLLPLFLFFSSHLHVGVVACRLGPFSKASTEKAWTNQTLQRGRRGSAVP